MKITSITYVVITTIILFGVIVMAVLGASFGWIFFLTVIGQILLVFKKQKVSILCDIHEDNRTY